jgi:NADH dehydrogenase/NADH:ubiquinone oxidoreductase subunit G
LLPSKLPVAGNCRMCLVEVEKAFDLEVERLQKEPVGKQELEKAKINLKPLLS